MARDVASPAACPAPIHLAHPQLGLARRRRLRANRPGPHAPRSTFATQIARLRSATRGGPGRTPRFSTPPERGRGSPRARSCDQAPPIPQALTSVDRAPTSTRARSHRPPALRRSGSAVGQSSSDVEGYAWATRRAIVGRSIGARAPCPRPHRADGSAPMHLRRRAAGVLLGARPRRLGSPARSGDHTPRHSKAPGASAPGSERNDELWPVRRSLRGVRDTQRAERACLRALSA